MRSLLFFFLIKPFYSLTKLLACFSDCVLTTLMKIPEYNYHGNFACMSYKGENITMCVIQDECSLHYIGCVEISVQINPSQKTELCQG